MPYYRIKNIKGKAYLYKIENRWKKRKSDSRQKVKGYLGRAYFPEKKQDISFTEFMKIYDLKQYVDVKDRSYIIKDIIRWTLYRYGFVEKKGSAMIAEIDDDKLKINLKRKEYHVNGKKRNFAVCTNEGYICNDTINKLLKFNSAADQREAGIELATLFINAGLELPKELFVEFFNKVYK